MLKRNDRKKEIEKKIIKKSHTCEFTYMQIYAKFARGWLTVKENDHSKCSNDIKGIFCKFVSNVSRPFVDSILCSTQTRPERERSINDSLRQLSQTNRTNERVLSIFKSFRLKMSFVSNSSNSLLAHGKKFIYDSMRNIYW